MFLAERTPLDDLSPISAALGLAEACNLAYNSEDIVRRGIAQWHWEPLAFFRTERDGGARVEEWGFAARGQGAVVLVFRGADSLADWLAQNSMEQVAIEHGAVHGGILAEIVSLKPVLDEVAGIAGNDGLPLWCAGHGLGGALALLSALRLDGDPRLVTFGQPRILDEAAAAKADEELGDRYLRFVNFDDVVCRLPPGYAHAGRRFHFDMTGRLRIHPHGDDQPGISPEEFVELGERIKQIQEETAQAVAGDDGSDPGLQALFTASVEGLIGGVLSHRINRYIEALRNWDRRERAERGEEVETVESAVPVAVRLAAGERPREIAGLGQEAVEAPGDEAEPKPRPEQSVLLPKGLEAELPDDGAEEAAANGDGDAGEEEAGGDGGGASPTEAGDAGQLASLTPAVLTVQDDWQAGPDLRVLSRFGQTATVLMTPQQHDALRIDGKVSEIEISREAGIPDLNRSISFTRADQVHAPGIDERGDKCIFGLIDTGIDILHDAFADGQGGTRVRAIWHQADDSGPSPRDVAPGIFSHDYGTLYLGDELNGLIRKFRDEHALLPGILRDDWNLTSSGHGTHVASIGAGGPFGALGGGMAPASPIVAVIPNLQTDPASPHSLGYSLSHVDAVHFLDAVANARTPVLDEALPMVINVSLGMNAGPHDGKTPLEVAFTMATANGTKRGVAIVKSAGNEAGHDGHARISAAEGARATISWISADDGRDADYFEVWFADLDDLAFRLRPPGVAAGDEAPKIQVDLDRPNRLSFVSVGGNTIQLQLLPGTGHGNQLTIEIKRGAQPIAPGQWELDVMGRAVPTPAGTVDAWVERIERRPVRFLNADDDFTISIPGTAETVICVGASDCDEFAAIGDFSSRGLTRDGLLKPDITAPGLNIEAARAGRSDTAATTVMSGTSMAAPHVAGAIALVMSARHKLAKGDSTARQFTAKQLLDGLIHSARNRTHHKRDWGHGKLDAEAFFNRMRNI